MQGVFIGHLSFYNKNQIRDKLFTGSYFLEQVRWQGYGIGLEKQYYIVLMIADIIDHKEEKIEQQLEEYDE